MLQTEQPSPTDRFEQFDADFLVHRTGRMASEAEKCQHSVKGGRSGRSEAHVHLPRRSRRPESLSGALGAFSYAPAGAGRKPRFPGAHAPG